jgi:hypothetical protein
MKKAQNKIDANVYKSFCVYAIMDNKGYINCLKHNGSVGYCVMETKRACLEADVGSTPCLALGSGAQSGVSKSRKRGLERCL